MLRAGLLPLWRDPDTVQIGIDPRRAVAFSGMAVASAVIGLLDGSRDREALLAAAAQHGVPREATERLLTLLAAAGVLVDSPARLLPALPADRWPQLAPVLAAASLAGQDGDGGARTLARRAGTVVEVRGTGPVAAGIAGLLTQSGLATIVSAVDLITTTKPPGRTEAPGRASAASAQPAAASRSSAATGVRSGAAGRGSASARNDAGGRGTRSSAGTRSGAASCDRLANARGSAATGSSAATRDRPADATTRGSAAQGKTAQGKTAQGNANRRRPVTSPADDRPARAVLPDLAAFGEPAGQPRHPRTAAAEPDLLILVGHQPPGLDTGGRALTKPHLMVYAGEALGVVGPLVRPGTSACLRCLDLTRTDRDPAWPLILAQLTRHQPAPVACDPVLAAMVAAQAAAQAVAFADGAPLAAVTNNGTLEIVTPAWSWRRRTWLPHPACLCQAATTQHRQDQRRPLNE